MRSYRHVAVLFCAGLGIGLAACGAPSGENQVVAFLDGAERQFETDEQRQVIEAALADLLELPERALRAKRYPDYQMNPEAWSVVEVLTHYFLPASPQAKLDPATFYLEVPHPLARQVVRKHLDALRPAPAQE